MSQRSVSSVSMPGVEQYIHSAVHCAIINHDYEALKQVLARLPTLPRAGQVVTEEESIAAEEKADAVSAVIDRRDVPGRETPLHLAVRLGDAKTVEMLMAAGADWSLQNEQGWSALQEAVCAREEGIAMIITRYYQPMAWAKWCRRLPRITGAMQRMRNFYMEITFNFESSVIPFIGRIAPSDTYRIWKQGSNLRADMTLAGFDGFKIQRADQSFLFLGDGTEDGKVSPGSLLVLTHKDKEVTNALEGAGAQPSEAEIAQEVAIMSQTNMYRPGIDVTEAELVPQLSWRRQEKTEMIGLWKAKVFDMHHVQISVRSRRVPGAMTDEELFAAETEAQADNEDGYADLLTEEEMQQLENVLSMDSMDLCDDSIDEGRPGNHVSIPDSIDHGSNSVNGATSGLSNSDRFGAVQPTGSVHEHKKGWFRWGKKTAKQEGANGGLAGNGRAEKLDASSSTPNGSLEKSQKQNASQTSETNRLSVGTKVVADNIDGSKRKVNRESSSSHRQTSSSNGNHESEYKKGLRPVLWLTPDFPLKTEEVLPLLDILANKVKAVRRLRELLTTKLPAGTFPVKVAIPIIPTIRVVVTFNKFEELSTNEEFCTPPSSPPQLSDGKGKEQSSWFTWIRGGRGHVGSSSSLQEDFVEEMDPFLIPSDYTWIDMKEKKRRLKAKKAKNKKGKRISSKPSGMMAKSENEV